jgi:ATP-dependent DNA helicase RecG
LRNEALAAFLRRIEVCEERGSGIDKIMQAIETHHYPLPEPQFDINKSYMTRASLRQRLHCSDNAAKQVIGQTCEKSLLRLANPEAKRNFQYLPYWA